MTEYDDRYIEFIRLFNERYFYDAHEVLEDLWLDATGAEAGFYRALIHSAAAYLHLLRGKLPGYAARVKSAEEGLAGFPDRYMNLDLLPLKAALRESRLRVEAGPNEGHSYRDEDVPKLTLIGD